MCTSRPEGVNLADFRENFVIIDLEPLTSQQQHDAVTCQLTGTSFGKSFADRLLAFSEIRKGHDRLYVEDAFADAAERKQIESFGVRDQLFLEDGETRNGEMRQRAADGGFIRVSIKPLSSHYLRKCASFFTESVLRRLDEGLMAEPNAEKAMKPIVAECEPFTTAAATAAAAGDTEEAVKALNDATILGVKLGLLVLNRQHKLRGKNKEDLRRKASSGDPVAKKEFNHLEELRAIAPETTASALWARIMVRTDQIYEVMEKMKDIFEEAVSDLCTRHGLAVKFGGLKDPVRVHEKAINDYMVDFSDWDDGRVIPEACVLDIVRCRVICEDATSMVALLHELRDGIPFSGGGSLKIIRAKNKFETTDPTHFRNILCNLYMEVPQGSCFAELQVQHAAILKYNDDSHAHDHYNFFRTLLAASYGPSLDLMLGRLIEFLDEVAGVPVLLSMLVLLFKHLKEGDTSPLPTDMFGLYESAMRLSIGDSSDGDRSAEAVFRTLASANQLAAQGQRREFTLRDVHDALSKQELQMWGEMTAKNNDVQGNLSLVKVLEAPDEVQLVAPTDASADKSSAAAHGGLFQFKHLSFQEAFSAQALIAQAANISSVLSWDCGPEAAGLIATPYHQNMIRIGSGRLGSALGGRTWNFDGLLKDLPESGVAALASLLNTNTVLRELSFKSNRLKAPFAVILFEAIGKNETLQTLTYATPASNPCPYVSVLWYFFRRAGHLPIECMSQARHELNWKRSRRCR